MVGGEWAAFFVFANAVTVFGRSSPSNVEHDETNFASNGSIGTVARAEGVGPTVHANLACDAPVYDDKWSSDMRRGLDAI